MEEAYSELYQQFLHLRSLCLRQAALLRQLTETRQQQKGPEDPPVEQDKPGPSSRDLTAAHSLSKNMEASSLISSDLLALDMSMLAVDGGCQTHKNQESPQNVPPLQSLEPYWGPGGSGDSRPALPARGTNVTDVFSSQAEGMLMSDVALQSHICDFCQAVFPGDASTRGDFLRHLYTHIT